MGEGGVVHHVFGDGTIHRRGGEELHIWAEVVSAGQALAAGLTGHTRFKRQLGVSEQTYYRWRNQYGGLKADDAKRLKELEKQNATLKRLLAEAELEKAALKELAEGNF